MLNFKPANKTCIHREWLCKNAHVSSYNGNRVPYGSKLRPRVKVLLANGNKASGDQGESGNSSDSKTFTSNASGEKPSAPVEHTKKSTAKDLFVCTADLFKKNFWSIVVIYAAKDFLSFLLHRFSQLFTNKVAEGLLGTPLPPTINPFWLYLDSAFLESQIGYQCSIVFFFLLALPFNILLSSLAMTTAALVCAPDKIQGVDPASLPALRQDKPSEVGTEGGAGTGGVSQGAGGEQTGERERSQGAPAGSAAGSEGLEKKGGVGEEKSGDTLGIPPGAAPAAAAAADGAAGSESPPSKPGLRASMGRGVRVARDSLPIAWSMIKRIWGTDLAFNLRALPLQGLSLLVLPVFWTVPRLLAIQLAVPASIFEGKAANEAIQRSKALMEGFKAAYGWPFVVFILGIRAIDTVRTTTLTAVPSYWWQDAIEVPILITAAFSFMKLILIRLQDLIPIAAFLLTAQALASRKEAESGDAVTNAPEQNTNPKPT